MAIVDCIHTATRNENQAEISAPVKDGIPGSRERKYRGGIGRPGDFMKTLFYCA